MVRQCGPIPSPQIDGHLLKFPALRALILFLFRLLDKMLSLGSASAIDWKTYADLIINANRRSS
jgi:hypothetical protein